MFIEFDSLKRDKTLAERGLDFADAAKILMVISLHLQIIDKIMLSRGI